MKIKNIRNFGLLTISMIMITVSACRKEDSKLHRSFTYYEVGFRTDNADWRDTSMVVATSDTTLIKQVDAQLALPVTQRKLVVGKLVAGSGGYNKNASHQFKWHFKEDDWQLADVTIEIYDGKPYTDVDVNFQYWMTNVQRFGAWSSYIKRKLPSQ